MQKTSINYVFAVVLAFAVLAFAVHKGPAKASAASPQSATFTGYVTDLKCKHNVNAECNRQCLGAGEEPALLVDGTGELFRLKNFDEAKKYAGAHVVINGTREGDMIKVSSVRMR